MRITDLLSEQFCFWQEIFLSFFVQFAFDFFPVFC